MAKHEEDDLIGPPGKPFKQRKFPWRLWLYALFMTAVAGAGGYFVWYYRGEAATAESAASKCLGSQESDKTNATNALNKANEDLGKQTTTATTCAKSLTEISADHAKIKNERDQLAKSLTVSKDELVALRTAKEQADIRMKAIDEIQQKFAKMIGTGDLKIAARRGSLVLSLPSEVLFPSGVADLTKEGEIRVLEVAFHLKRLPDRRFLVLGHTDNQPPLKNSLYRDNWELSTARALTVARVLAQGGMKKENLIVAGAGEHDELVPNKDVASMARNRRIEIALLPAINELPPLPASLDKKP